MQNIQHKIDLNISRPNNFGYIHIVQGDHDSEVVIATIYDGNKLYSIDAPQIFVQGSTTDGGLIMVDDVVVSEDKHSIQFPITAEIASVAGDVTCIATFINGSQKKSTFPFVIKATKDVTGRTPTTVITTIIDYVDRAEKAAQEAEDTLKSFEYITNEQIDSLFD